MSRELSPAIFLDRDGVINRDTGYTHKIEELEILPGVVEGCQKLRAAGYKLIIVTNQSGIARGYYDESDYQDFTEHLLSRLAQSYIEFSGVYYCPHHENGTKAQYTKYCDCRKPAAGMLLQAMDDLSIDATQSAMIGDRLSDLKAANNAGLAKAILVRTGKPVSKDAVEHADFTAPHFLDAVDWILNNLKKIVK